MPKRSKFRQLSVKSLVLFSLLAGTVPIHTYADSSQITADSVFDVPVVGAVWVNDKSYFELRDVRLSVNTEGKTVTFTVKAVNGGDTDLLFIDYWVRLISSSGANITINTMPQDKDKNVIPSGGSQEIKFYANVSSAIQLSDLQFKVIKWDFNSADYQRTLGILPIPNYYNTVAPVGAKANIRISKTSMQGFIPKMTLKTDDENYLPTVSLELTNTDVRSLKLPTLTYMLRTEEGLMYPLTATGVTNTTTIDPLMTKEIPLTGKIPLSIANQNWQLVITETTAISDTVNVTTAFAEMQIPAATEDQSAIERTQSFTNDSGKYTIQLENIKRVPWEDDDLLTTSIVLTTAEDKSLPIPALQGYIELDDTVRVDVKVVQTDNIIGIQPGKEVRLLLLGTIPYTYDYSRLTVHLQEKPKTTPTATTVIPDLVTFKVEDNFVDSMPVVAANEHYKISTVGRSSDFTIHALQNYSGKNSDLLVAQLEIENLEKRANELPKLIAYFKGTDGTIYPAKISEIKTKINPSGKAVLSISSNIAKSKSSDIAELVVGEGLKDSKYSTIDATPDSYINPVAFTLPAQQDAVVDTFKELDLFPYKLGISRVGTSVDKTKVTIKFDYNLEKDSQYEINSDDYKVIVELKDSKGDATLSSTFTLDKDLQTTTGAANTTAGTTLLFGQNKMEVSITDADFMFKVNTLKTYDLNIYQVFQGQKRLIATKQFDWFYYSD